MWKAEKARRELLVKSARLDMAALLVLAVVCFLPLHGELDCAGTHAWESLLLAYFGLPVWCVAFLYRPRSLVKWGWDVEVFGGMLVAELLLIGWHAPLLWGGDGVDLVSRDAAARLCGAGGGVGLVACACLPADVGRCGLARRLPH